jgi:hypothetical protein
VNAPKQLLAKDLPKFSSTLTNKPIKMTTSQSFNRIEVLQSKIDWATEQLASPANTYNTKYIIELCEMVKVASEAILAVQKIE